MGKSPTACRVVKVGIGVVVVGLAACSQTRQEPIEPPPGFSERPSASSVGAEQAEELTASRHIYDEDGDGFVSRAEAEGYYRRSFGHLDDNKDGQLAPAELEPEEPSALDLGVAFEEPVARTEQEYVDDNLRRYNLRADQTIGMMSTRDFGEMVGGSDPAISSPRPGLLP
jgi:hypothetical protein